MIRTLAILSLALLATLSACGNNDRAEIEQRTKEVMAVHDEAMAEMGTMHDLELQLTSRLAAANEADGTRAELERAVAALQEAQQAMMTWMHQYRAPDPAGDPAVARAYLQQQREQIERVRDLTVHALALAKQAATNP